MKVLIVDFNEREITEDAAICPDDPNNISVSDLQIGEKIIVRDAEMEMTAVVAVDLYQNYIAVFDRNAILDLI